MKTTRQKLVRILGMFTLLTATAVIANTSTLEAPSITTTEEKYMVMDDFNKSTTQKFAARWHIYTDSGASGDSEATFEVLAEHQLKLKGKFGKQFAYPFFGLRSFFNAGGTPVDLSAYKGIRLKTKGDYSFTVQVLTSTVTDGNEFSIDINASEKWHIVDIPFERATQSPYFGKQVSFSASKIRGLGIHVKGFPGAKSSAILIDEIGFY